MAWIKTLGLEEATGRLKDQYDAAMHRADHEPEPAGT